MTIAAQPAEQAHRAVQDAPEGRFAVHLENFEGPFDLLLGLIAKHELDITEVALSEVTDEFLDHVRTVGQHADLDHTSAFLVVAATLLDLKAARLLPGAEVEDEEDLAALEARDLLFARLLQYHAYRQVAALLAEQMAAESRRFARAVSLHERFAALRPEVLIGSDVEGLAALAAQALARPPAPALPVDHLHAPQASVREEATTLVDRLRRAGTATFRALSADAPTQASTVARFLALLELYRDGAVAFEQLSPLGDLTVRWTGSSQGDLELSAEFGAESDRRGRSTPGEP